VKAVERSSGAKVFPISAPLDEGLGPLLDAIIEHVGKVAVEAQAGPSSEKSWSPL